MINEWRPNLWQRISAARQLMRDSSLMKRAVGKAVTYAVDGQTIHGTIYYPRGKDPAPAVLLLHTSSGLSPREHALAIALADEGYTSLVIGYAKKIRSRDLNKDDQRKRLEEITIGGLRALQEDPRTDAHRTAVIGFSFGGYFAARLACANLAIPPAAVVIFYGVFPSQESQIANLRAPLLVLQGEGDSANFVANAKRIKELADFYHRECEVIFWPGAGHQFDLFEPKSAAAQDAWQQTLAFLRKRLATSE